MEILQLGSCVFSAISVVVAKTRLNILTFFERFGQRFGKRKDKSACCYSMAACDFEDLPFQTGPCVTLVAECAPDQEANLEVSYTEMAVPPKVERRWVTIYADCKASIPPGGKKNIYTGVKLPHANLKIKDQEFVVETKGSRGEEEYIYAHVIETLDEFLMVRVYNYLSETWLSYKRGDELLHLFLAVNVAFKKSEEQDNSEKHVSRLRRRD